MSVVKKYTVKPRLASLIRKPGGLHVGEAIKRGQAVIEDRRELCLNEIDEGLAAMEALFAQPGYDIEEMYVIATRVIGACVIFSDEILASAARSLCDLIDRASETGRINQSSVQVHLASLRLLHRSDAPPEAQAQILQGLTQVVEKQERQAQAQAEAQARAEAAASAGG